MRWKAEWLLLPLFALPLLLALGLHLWASAAHEHDLDVYRLQTREQVARLTAPEGPAARFVREWDGGPYEFSDALWVTAAFEDGRVLRVAAHGIGGYWTFTDDFPAGLPAEALVDPATRLKIETGTAPINLPEIDDRTRALHGMLREPSGASGALRTVRFAPATKRVILERWMKTYDEPWMPAALRFLRTVEAVSADLPPKLLPGHHKRDGHAVVRNAREDTFDVPLADEIKAQHVVADPANGDIDLWFSSTPVARISDATILQQVSLDAPLVGTWMFAHRGGTGWWHSSRFVPWVGPGIVVLLFLLALPGALWFALRRRRKLDEARTRFINELAHDLRTPLTSLRLHAEMLGSGRTPDGRRGHYLGLIERESSRLSALLGNLLDLSRLDGARAALHPQSLTVASAVEQARHAFVAVHPDRAKDLTFSGDEDVTVQADAAALARVLGNLLENAGKFTKAGTPIRVAWSRAGTHVRLEVSDDGPGIPTDEQRTIFDRYSRGAGAKKDGVAGSGLGLALVKELTTRMEGSVRLQPTPRGATFRIRLPKGDDA